MARLAEVGFSQSYTYFTWRTEQHGPEGLWAYLEELAHGPDGRLHAAQLLAQHARHPVRSAARRAAGGLRPPRCAGRHAEPLLRRLQRLRAVREPPASSANEEYLDSEKYEIKHRDFSPARHPDPIAQRPQAHPPAPSGLLPAALHPLPPERQPGDHRLFQDQRRRRRRRADRRHPRPQSDAGDDPASRHRAARACRRPAVLRGRRAVRRALLVERPTLSSASTPCPGGPRPCVGPSRRVTRRPAWVQRLRDERRT